MRMGSTLAALAASVAIASPALAGPPYITDDPAPTERGRWEVYNFLSGSHVAGETGGEGGIDLNYGAAQDLQLTLVLPFIYDRSARRTDLGVGVVEAAAKLKVLHQQEGSWQPDVALFPRLFLPTAEAKFASVHTNLLLPVWVGKDFGRWSVFGGGGWQLNPGEGHRDFWTAGVAVTRQVNDRLNLGGEISHRSADSRDGRAFSGVNLGMIYKLSDHWSLLASGGPGIQNARTEGRYDFYVAVKADY